MKSIVDFVYKNQNNIYRIVLFCLTVFLIVYFFPKGYKFKYDIDKNTPWPYDNLFASFDYSILKSDEELELEKQEIINNHIPYYNYDTKIFTVNRKKLEEEIKITPDFDSLLFIKKEDLSKFLLSTFDKIYNKGIRQNNDRFDNSKVIYLKSGNEIKEVFIGAIPKKADLNTIILQSLQDTPYYIYRDEIKKIVYKNVKINVSFNEDLTKKSLDQELKTISYTRGTVKKGSKIISKGDIVDNDKYQKLISLKAEYQNQDWDDNTYYTVLAGYILLVSLALLMLLLFLKKYREDIYEDINKVTFIFINLLFVVFLSILVLHFNKDFIYVVPICVLPLTLKTFFDARLGLFTHVITVLILGFIVPNSFEYMFLQIIAGIVTILTVSELYKRANLFVSVFQITIVYVFSYLAFNLIQEGSIYEIEANIFLLFLLSGVGLLFVQPLIYGYEKLFGLISDLSLLELTDTNSKLLKELAEIAPGTFHHSLNVANLAEASANEIGANSLLVRVGGLYHDIGKMKQPTYFSENQKSTVSAHDEIDAKESAKIIINHRLFGIEIAKKNKLPDKIIDFIRTHHGTTLVYYFYKKHQKETNGNVSEEDFRYPGPKPFNRETAILMMCDSIEAASKSLKEPNTQTINTFVENIINKQIEEKQFLHANITFKEIEQIKKILKSKLKNIYHLRVEYPE